MSYNDYKLELLNLIRHGCLKELENFIYMDENKGNRSLLKSDEIAKANVINIVLNIGDRHLCEIILSLFEIDDEFPDYERMSDIIYIGDLRYKSNFVNKKNNIYYIFDLYNLDGYDRSISMEDLYNLCEDELCFERIRVIIEEKICRDLDNNEINYILEKSREYRDYINNEYNNIIENIIENEGYMDSDMECYNMLCNYLGKRPNKFELKLMMRMNI